MTRKNFKNSVRSIFIQALTFYSLVFCLESQAAIGGGYQIIAHPSVGTAGLSLEEVKQIMLTNQTTWKDGKKVAIVALSPDSSEADGIAGDFMGMTGTQAKKFWLTKVFNGVLPSLPATVDTPEELVEKVASTPGAIAILPKGVPVGRAKVLTIR